MLAADQVTLFYQQIEAQNLQHLLYGVSSAKTNMFFLCKNKQNWVYVV